jgi:hypothetical protein
MSIKRNYLLGQGEKLAVNEVVKLGFGTGRDPYTFHEAKQTMIALARATTESLEQLPASACPRDEAVAALVLHPKYLSKSSYPTDLLRETGLRPIGSKAVTITPRKSHLKSRPVPGASAELFVAGPRQRFRDFSQGIKSWSDSTPGAGDLIKVENFRALSAAERVKPIRSKAKEILFEIVLHAGNRKHCKYILDAFEEHLRLLDIEVDMDKRIDADNLSFVPVRTERTRINAVAEFSFLRIAREMPRLRELWPASGRGTSTLKPFCCTPPDQGPLDKTIRVAVFDGGQPDVPSLSKFVKQIDTEGLVGRVEIYEKHGLAVTSALLFGPIQPDTQIERPYATIDHYRVLDQEAEDDTEASVYPVLKRIVAVLQAEKYDFVNFSIGPAIPIDDDDIHPWTAMIDPLLASGRTLASVAVGNGGEQDAAAGLNRIQPPSDCVNALSVGASDGTHAKWSRAPYSSVGHGRCPGIVKPDGVVFGGVPKSPFWVIGYDDPNLAMPVTGTSFASPSALRAAIGVRAHLGPVISPLGLKALLIHNADPNGHEKSEVGWGQICTDVEKLITCATNTVHVVYQGNLDPKKFLRARIPMPRAAIEGLVTIKVTICYATETDPQHPLTYTRSGLQIFFRKDRNKIPPGKSNPKPATFFKTGLGKPEQLIRNDAHQWETVRQETKRMRGQDLKAPCLDIHYNPREEGHDTEGEEIPYAMIVTLHAPKMPDLFEQIWDRYRFQLSELKPRLELPIRIR